MAIGYMRGAAEDIGRASMQRFALDNNIELERIFEDSPGRFVNFRLVQTLTKRGLIDTLLLRGTEDLGDDRYMALESRLFFERNGIRLIFMNKPSVDRRHDIALGIHRYYSFITETDESYGLMLPLRNTRHVFSRVPPFGYNVEDGVPVVNEAEAERVRMVFKSYANGASIAEIVKSMGDFTSARGKKFSNMTVKTLLRNERYLGRLSKKGYHLPSLITYDLWLSAHERLEREYAPDREPEPYFDTVRRLCPIVFYRGSANENFRLGEYYRSAVAVDSDRLESAVEKIIAAYCKQENADSFYEYVLEEKKQAEIALCSAEKEYEAVSKQFGIKLKALIKGAREEEDQRELEDLTDRKNIYGMRRRRIVSENELFSITKEQVDGFFERARRISKLSVEERSWIAGTLVRYIAISKDEIAVFISNPLTGRVKRRILTEI